MTTRLPRPTDNAFLAASPTSGSLEPTYGGALSFMRRPYSRNLAGVDVAIWGIPFDGAVSNRPGTRFGPQAIRRASAIFDGDPQYPRRTDPFQTLTVIDYGDCSFDYGRPAEIPGWIERQAADILAAGPRLFSLGGDHSVTYPLLKAHAAKYGPLPLVHFDAHQDTWEDRGDRTDHATFVRRAVNEGLIDRDRSVQIGIRTRAPEDFGIAIIEPDEMEDLGVAGAAMRIQEVVGQSRAYLTFDIDCLDPAFAPGTGTPVAGGLSSREALGILMRLDEIDFVGGDVVEVSPPYDHADITAIAGATVAMNWLLLAADRANERRYSGIDRYR